MKKAVKKLDQAVAKHGVTKLAEKLQVSRQVISKIRRDDYDPKNMTIGLARKLKDHAGIYLEDWFEDAKYFITVAQWEDFTGQKIPEELWVWENYDGDYLPTLWGMTVMSKEKCYVMQKPE